MSRPSLAVALSIGIFVLGCGSGAAPVVEAVAAPAAHPNLLLLLADDLGADKISAYAGDFPGYAAEAAFLPRTPTVDGLAASGLRFTTAWANPVCSPTRAALLTGRYGFRTGVGTTVPMSPGLDPASAVTIAQVLSGDATARYATGLFGKWHLGTEGVRGTTDWRVGSDGGVRVVADGPNPLRFGWGVYDGNLTGRIEDYRAWTRVQAYAADRSTVSMEHGYATDVTADAAVAWIKAQKTPWFAMVALNAPHAAGQDRSYKASDLGPSCGVPASGAGQPELFRGLMECLDQRIGRLLSDIPKEQLRDTLIVFMGDNGTESIALDGPFAELGAKRQIGKATTYESGVRVPLTVTSGQNWLEWGACSTADRAGGKCALSDGLVRAPGRPVTVPVGAVDLYATLADVAGVRQMTGEDSVSFAPCLSGTGAGCNSPGGRARALYAEDFKYGQGAAVQVAWVGYREGADKLVGSVRNQMGCITLELYRLDQDPWERTNLAEANPSRLGELVSAVEQLGPGWMRGLPRCTGAEQPAPGRFNGGGRPGGGRFGGGRP